jgi:phospholipase C
MGNDDRRTDSRRRRPDLQAQRVSRRTLFKGGLAVGAGAAALGLSSPAGASVERALAIDPVSTNPTLSDIRHVVFLMQENRSFDHYFGTLSGVRGFSDPKVLTNEINGVRVPVWNQYGYQPGIGVDPSGYLQPFDLQQQFPTDNGDCTNAISHEWGPQHQSWDGGKMDSFVQAHLEADGDANFVATMGYFDRAELPFYYALADAFTICDAYHCSVLGPTDPNRVVALSGTNRSCRRGRRSRPRDADDRAGAEVREILVDHALALGKPAQPVPPALPDASLTVPVVDEEVVVNALTGTFDDGFTYAPPTQNDMPVQETGPPRPAPPR